MGIILYPRQIHKAAPFNLIYKLEDNRLKNESKGIFEAETYQIGTVGERTFSIQEFGIPNVNIFNFRFLTRRLKKNGYGIDIADWDKRQCARFKDNRQGFLHRLNPFGVTKVVDLGCVHPPQNNGLEVII